MEDNAQYKNITQRLAACCKEGEALTPLGDGTDNIDQIDILIDEARAIFPQEATANQG